MGGGGGGGGSGSAARVTELPITYGAFGAAYAIRGGQRISLTGSSSVAIRDGDHLVTEGGYIYGMEHGGVPHETTGDRIILMLFPNSEAALSVQVFKREDSTGTITCHMIKRVELVRGLFWLQLSTTEKLEDALAIAPGFPQLEFKPVAGEFGRRKEVEGFIELGGGNVTVFAMTQRVVHKSAGVDAVIGDPLHGVTKGKITATANALYLTRLTDHPDKRTSVAYEIKKMLLSDPPRGKGAGDAFDFSMPPYSPPLDGDKVVRKQVRRTVPGIDETAGGYWNTMRKTGDEHRKRAADIREKYWDDPRERDKHLHEEYLQQSREEKAAGEASGKGEADLIEAGKKGLTAFTAEAPISKSLKYREVSFDFSKAEKGTERGLAKSPKGKEYLLLRFRAVSSAKGIVFFDPNAEFSLLAGGGIIPLDNYKLETALEPGKISEGYLQFFVPEAAKSFVLQLGKKNDNKLTMDVSV